MFRGCLHRRRRTLRYLVLVISVVVLINYALSHTSIFSVQYLETDARGHSLVKLAQEAIDSGDGGIDQGPVGVKVAPDFHEINAVQSDIDEHLPQPPLHPDPKMPPKPDDLPQNPGVIPQKPDDTQQNPDVIPQKPDEIPHNPDAVPQKPDEIPLNPDVVPQKPDEIPLNPDVVPQKQDEIPHNPDVPQKPDEIPQHPDIIPPNQEKIPQNPIEVPPIIGDSSDNKTGRGLAERNDKQVVPNFKVQYAQCDDLFNQNLTAIKLAQSYTREPTADAEYTKMAGNCTDFLWRRQYIMQPVTTEEAEFPIAFSLLMFKEVEHAERLLRAVYRPQNVYCVHVDTKASTDVFEGMSAIVDCLPNVFMAQQRYDVQWGKWTIIEPELQCMRELWSYPVKWKYFINLTGQEFPLKTNHEIVRILKAFNGANNLEGTVKRKNKPRTEFIWRDGKNTHIEKPPAPHNITIAKGSVHIVVQRGYVDFLLHDQKALDFIEWTKETDIPDETLFSSLNISPQIGIPGAKIGDPETNNGMNPFLVRYKNWQSGLFRRPCGGKWVRTVCVFGVPDLHVLHDKKQLFANKFHLTYQPLALDCMEEYLYSRIRAELAGNTDFNTTYYATRDFVRHHVNNYAL